MKQSFLSLNYYTFKHIIIKTFTHQNRKKEIGNREREFIYIWENLQLKSGDAGLHRPGERKVIVKANSKRSTFNKQQIEINL